MATGRKSDTSKTAQVGQSANQATHGNGSTKVRRDPARTAARLFARPFSAFRRVSVRLSALGFFSAGPGIPGNRHFKLDGAAGFDVNQTDLKRRRVRGHAYKASARRQSTRRAQAYRPGSSRRQRSRGSVRRKTRCCRHRSSWYPGGRQQQKGPHPQRTEPRGRDSRRSVPPSRARTSQQPESRAPSPMRVLPGWLSEIRVVLPPQQRTLRAAAKRPIPLLETA